MPDPNYESIRQLVLELLQPRIESLGMDRSALTDELSLLDSGLVDSMSLMDIVLALEQRVGRKLDLSRLTPDDFTSISGLVNFVLASI